MWTIGICDDEQDMRTQLKDALLRFSGEVNEPLEFICYRSAEELTQEISPKVDILLLDIRMGKLSGMEAARRLRDKGFQLPIIFITTMAQYAIEGYSVHAFSFLKKPIQYQQLKLVLCDAIRVLRRGRGDSIQLTWNGQTMHVQTQDILYLEAYGHRVDMHMVNGEVLPCSPSLSELEEMLGPFGFYRAHKSYLINFEYLQKVELTELVFANGLTLPLSKHRRKDLRIAFANYCGGKML